MDPGVIAEGTGFEPVDLLQPLVFKTSAIDHSANLPKVRSYYRGERTQPLL